MAPLLEIAELSTEIRLSGSVVRALDGVSLTVRAGECLGLVGESGSGKTITALSVLGLLPPGAAVTGGAISLDGTDLVTLGPAELRRVRGAEIAMIFQDPASSLNPTMSVGAQVAEVLAIHRGLRGRAAAQAAVAALELARIPDPERVAARYPHELSGGMRQRVMIAMALAGEPRLLIADEPTTALDVTTQLEILRLLDELRQRLSMAVILITHDLGVIGAHTDRVAVMYGGRIVESAATAAVFGGPRHPYTQALFDALPAGPETAAPGRRALYSIPGRPPDLATGAAGCRFAPRCRNARDYCASQVPVLDGEHPGHLYACFFPVSRQAAAAPWAPAAAPEAGLPEPSPREMRLLTGLDGGPAGQGGVPWADAPPPPGVTDPSAGAGPLLRVSGLVKSYPVTAGAVLPHRTGSVSAVADLSFEIAAGQTFGLVGESGCGKTTVARLLTGLERADAGSVIFRGAERSGLSRRELRRGRPGIQIMFQDPFGSLDPRQRVETILREPLVIQKVGRKRSHWRTVARILDEVGLPADAAQRFPREFSGGQRQRLALARALILEPDLIVADEPVSALDVSVQAQILNLMRKLQRQYGLSYLLISHDLSVVRHMADVIGVMYLGKLVESGPSQAVCASPAHPYTRGLLDAVPVVALSAAGGQASDVGQAPRRGIGGEPPSAASPPSGCRFRTRCPLAKEICASSEPPLRRAATGQLVACHFPLLPPGPGTSAMPGPAVTASRSDVR